MLTGITLTGMTLAAVDAFLYPGAWSRPTGGGRRGLVRRGCPRGQPRRHRLAQEHCRQPENHQGLSRPQQCRHARGDAGEAHQAQRVGDARVKQAEQDERQHQPRRPHPFPGEGERDPERGGAGGELKYQEGDGRDRGKKGFAEDGGAAPEGAGEDQEDSRRTARRGAHRRTLQKGFVRVKRIQPWRLSHPSASQRS